MSAQARRPGAADGLILRALPVALAATALGVMATLNWQVAIGTALALAVLAVVVLRTLLVLALVGVSVAGAVGWLTTVDPALAVAVTIGLAGAIVIAVRGELMVPLMVVTVFVEGLQIGGYALTFILAPIALVFLVGELSAGRARLPGGVLSAWLAAYGVWAFASALWTDHFADTVTALVALAVAGVYFLAFGSLVTTRADVVRLLWGIAVGASVTGVVAVAQFASAGGRASGLQGDPNYFAAYQIIAVPALIVLTGTVTGAGQKLAANAALLITFGSVLVSLSRGGLIALGLVTLIALLIPSRFLFGSTRRRLATLGALVTCGVLLFSVVSSSFLPRLQEGFGGGNTTESAGAGRINEWRAAWTSIQESPVFGLGYGGFVPASNQLLLATPGVDFTNFRLDPNGIEAHSAYVSTTAELGVPGLVLFVGALTSALAALVAVARRARDSLMRRSAAAFAVALVGWCITSLFLSSEGARPLGMLFGLAAAFAAIGRVQDAPTRARPLGRPLLAAGRPGPR